MAKAEGKMGKDIEAAVRRAKGVLAGQTADAVLPKIETASALRSAIAAVPKSEAAQTARELPGPAENYYQKLRYD